MHNDWQVAKGEGEGGGFMPLLDGPRVVIQWEGFVIPLISGGISRSFIAVKASNCVLVYRDIETPNAFLAARRGGGAVLVISDFSLLRRLLHLAGTDQATRSECVRSTTHKLQGLPTRPRS